MAVAHMGLNLRPAQMIIKRRLAMYRFVVAVCHRRLGKTRLAVDWLIEEALRSTLEDYRGYYFCNTQKQAKMVSWLYFKRALDPLARLGMVDFNETELRVDMPNAAKIYLGSAESIENYRGIYIDRIVIDEIASWANATYAYEEVLRPAMADREAHALIIGTVKGLNQFYTFYQYGLSQDPMFEDYCTVDLKASMTGVLPDKELRLLQATMSPGAYDREMENNFFANVPDTLISAMEVMDATKREVDPYLVALSPVIVGIDVGLTGDPSVMCVRQGPRIREFIEIKSEDPMLTAGIMSRHLKSIKPTPTTVYGDAGQGMAVLSRLRQLGHHNVIDVFFNATSDLPNCFNKRAAMAYRVKEFMGHGQIPDDKEFLQEAVNQYLEEDPDQKVRLIKKRKIRDIIKRSPNKMDAAMLSLAEPDEDQQDMYELAQKTGMTIQELTTFQTALEASRRKQQDQNGQYDVLDWFNASYEGNGWV